MEYGVDLLHRKSFLDLYDEKVYRLLITLQNVYWVVALADKNLIIFIREKFSVFTIVDSYTTKLKGSIKEGNIVGKIATNNFGTYL